MSNKTFLEALREIRPLIEIGRQRFICHALEHIGCNMYTKRIMKQLDGFDTYSDWLRVTHPEFRDERLPYDLRPGRLAWIDDMIAREIKAGRK